MRGMIHRSASSASPDEARELEVCTKSVRVGSHKVADGFALLPADLGHGTSGRYRADKAAVPGDESVISLSFRHRECWTGALSGAPFHDSLRGPDSPHL